MQDYRLEQDWLVEQRLLTPKDILGTAAAQEGGNVELFIWRGMANSREHKRCLNGRSLV